MRRSLKYQSIGWLVMANVDIRHHKWTSLNISFSAKPRLAEGSHAIVFIKFALFVSDFFFVCFGVDPACLQSPATSGSSNPYFLTFILNAVALSSVQSCSYLVYITKHKAQLRLTEIFFKYLDAKILDIFYILYRNMNVCTTFYGTTKFNLMVVLDKKLGKL